MIGKSEDIQRLYLDALSFRLMREGFSPYLARREAKRLIEGNM